jgi:hypothetical protein
MKMEMTEVERLKMENLNLKRFALEVQMQQVNAARLNLIAELEIAHPGYEWDEQRGFVQKEELEEVLT